MKKQARLLSALALSIGMSLAATPGAMATLPAQVQGQALPSLAPMLEKVLPAVVSVHVEGTDSGQQAQDIPEPLKRFFGQAPDNPSRNRLRALVQVSSLMRLKVTFSPTTTW